MYHAPCTESVINIVSLTAHKPPMEFDPLITHYLYGSSAGFSEAFYPHFKIEGT